MEDMTLREVCNNVKVSRRAVQGYEKAGLVSASGKNERGYLLYNKESQERIRRIRLYQQLGFTLKEIGDIIDASEKQLREKLERRIAEMEREKHQFETLIRQAYELLEKL